MAVGVNVGRMKEHHIRLILPDNIAGTAHDKPLRRRMNSDLIVPDMAFHDLQHLLAGAHAFPRLTGRILRKLSPVFIDQIINGRMVARYRPEDGCCRVSRLFRLSKNILFPSGITVIPLPWKRRCSRYHLQIPRDAVLIRPHAAAHRGMAGIRNGRVDRIDFLDHTAACQVFLIIG